MLNASNFAQIRLPVQALNCWNLCIINLPVKLRCDILAQSFASILMTTYQYE